MSVKFDTVEEANDEESVGSLFKPLVELERQTPVTGEENEDVMFACRVKLFEFGDVYKREWQEKGISELKIMKDRTNKRNRILIRHEKSLQTLSNFLVSHDIPDLKAHSGSDKAWVMATPNDFTVPGRPIERVSYFLARAHTLSSFLYLYLYLSIYLSLSLSLYLYILCS